MPTIISTRPAKKSGLAFWMERVLEECERASESFAADPVHDLRVALRRCRSLADGLMAMDPDPTWKQMKKSGKRLFSRLGELRDVQVMEEWVHRFDTPGDPVTSVLLQFLAGREIQLKQEAAQALAEFDRKQWRRWSKQLPRRATRLRPGSAVFKHLALERWTEGYRLHQQAMRSRSQVTLHRLRIGLKRFRYIVENFLPEQHAAWSNALKDLQDLLGDVHDLDVLWTMVQQVNAFPGDEARSRWHSRIAEERARRVEKYREKMLGRTALWHLWRAELPQGEEIRSGAMRRLKLWASFLDPDVKHSNHVARLALQLYDGLAAAGPQPTGVEDCETLRLAALLHDVGRSKGENGRHKATFRLIQRIDPPLGVSAAELHMAGVVARYVRGALPGAGQKTLLGLSLTQKQTASRLAGILRLANAFGADRSGRIRNLEVRPQNGFLLIAAQGYSARSRQAQNIAAARHLLEVVQRRPVLIKALRKPATKSKV